MDGAWTVDAAHAAGRAAAARCASPAATTCINALAAIACALAAGVSLDAIAEGWTPSSRSRAARAPARCAAGGRAITLVDDTYNANPDSMRAAIDVLAALPGPRLLVLGDMGEVGDAGPAIPCRGRRLCARERGIETLFALGAQSVHATPSATAFGARRAAISTTSTRSTRRAATHCPRCGSVLVKGSRFMKMERVVQAIAGCARRTNKHERRPVMPHEPRAFTPCC